MQTRGPQRDMSIDLVTIGIFEGKAVANALPVFFRSRRVAKGDACYCIGELLPVGFDVLPGVGVTGKVSWPPLCFEPGVRRVQERRGQWPGQIPGKRKFARLDRECESLFIFLRGQNALAAQAGKYRVALIFLAFAYLP